MIAALDRLRALIEKANFNPNQPRAPGPGPGAGQWIHVGGYAQEPQPGIGHNGGPSLVDPPDIPKQEPPTKPLDLPRRKRSRNGSPCLAHGASLGLRSPWPRSKPQIGSGRNCLRSGPIAIHPRRWMSWSLVPGKRGQAHRHHIVEQMQAERDGYPRSTIDGLDNVVNVPIYKHREISAWYQKVNPDFGDLSPREYLRGKDWSERARIGHLSLRKFGVLKP